MTVKGRLLVWGGGTKAVYCNDWNADAREVVVARVDDAVKVIYDRDSTLAVIDTIKVSHYRAREAAHGNGGHFLRRFRTCAKPRSSSTRSSRTIRLLLLLLLIYMLWSENPAVKGRVRTNNSKTDTYKIEIRRNKDNTLIADAFELAAGKSISTLTLLEAPEFGNTDCTVTIRIRTASRSAPCEPNSLHTAYLWPKEVQ